MKDREYLTQLTLSAHKLTIKHGSYKNIKKEKKGCANNVP